VSSRSRSASAAAATSSPPRRQTGEAPTTPFQISNGSSERLEPEPNEILEFLRIPVNPCREVHLTSIRPDQIAASAIRGEHIVFQGEMNYSQRGIRVSSQGETDDPSARIHDYRQWIEDAESVTHYHPDQQRRWMFNKSEPDPTEKARVNKLADNSGGLFALVVEAEFNSTDPLIQGRIAALRAAFSQLEKMLK